MNEKIDLLDRENFIQNVIKLVTQLSENKGGCCFAIEGDWGIGKTFVLEEIENQLKIIQSEESVDDRYFVFHYNCWKYDYYEEPSIAIISAMLATIQESEAIINSKFDEIARESFKNIKEKITEIAKTIVKNKIGIDLISTVEDIQEKVADSEKGTYEFNNMFNFDQTIEKVRENLQEIAKKKTIVFVVDELDRCIPSYAIKVLERLHHIFYGLNNIVVIMAVDRNQLEHSVEEMFGKRTGSINIEKYLKKFIDFSVKLDEGSINESFAEKYKFYFSKFSDASIRNKEEENLNNALRELLSGIDIRSQEKIIEKANMVHSIIYNQKADISVMLFEIMYEVFCLQGIYNMNRIATIEENVPRNIEQSFGERKIEFLKSMEKASWDKKIYPTANIQKKCMVFNLYGKVFWYFANIFNQDQNPYVELNSHNRKINNQLEIAKKYCEFCEIIK